MALKYDFNITLTDNIYVDAFVYANNHLYNLLGYSLVALFFGVLLYVYFKRNNDFGLSSAYALFASTIVAIIFYYMQVFINNKYSTSIIIIHGSVLFTMAILNVVAFALLKYETNKFNQ